MSDKIGICWSGWSIVWLTSIEAHASRRKTVSTALAGIVITRRTPSSMAGPNIFGRCPWRSHCACVNVHVVEEREIPKKQQSTDIPNERPRWITTFSEPNNLWSDEQNYLTGTQGAWKSSRKPLWLVVAIFTSSCFSGIFAPVGLWYSVL